MNSSFSLSHLLTQNVTVLNSRSPSLTNRNSENEMTGTGYTFLGLWEILRRQFVCFMFVFNGFYSAA